MIKMLIVVVVCYTICYLPSYTYWVMSWKGVFLKLRK